MVIGIFGENCTGKSTLAEALNAATGARIFTGKDYLRLAKSEDMAKQQFRALLTGAVTWEDVIYVITEKAHLAFLPEGALRVLVTAELSTIRARFAARMGGTLPPPVEKMLERKHGLFDHVPHHIHIHTDTEDTAAAAAKILAASKIGAGQ